MAATIDDLEARIDALEQALASGQSDQLFPNVLSVNPDGSIGANLTGHLHAQGVDFDEPQAFNTQTSQIRWVRASDGAVAAVMETDSTVGVVPPDLYAATAIEARRSGNAQSASVVLRTLGLDDGDSTQVQVLGYNRAAHPGQSMVAVQTMPAISAMILDDLARSDFAQLGNVQIFTGVGPPPIVWNVPITSSRAIFVVGGTGWCAAGAPVKSGFPVFFNGVQRAGLDHWWNQNLVYMAITPAVFVMTGLTPGTYTLNVNASGGAATSDANGRFFALVIN